ncbi:hypothetical protein ES754_05285 [Psychrobacter frigidicola]|uniref:Lipoprotein n=1 Tax=Psychrobacter frigidicola TaxID=45611 RepID=A0A5C7A6M3_9GAMM|nr:hypothetical protein [Psychrobacter frigidicola]TXD98340.1 hypothetical protein ES754_05285 [Psychrobacter frigidicola]
MKKLFISTAMLATFALAGCTTTGANTNPSTIPGAAGTAIGTVNSAGMNVLKTVIDNQCRYEIEKQPAWRIVSAAMNERQQEAATSKVCGCVSEQAPQQVTLVELGNAAINSNYRVQLATKVIANTLQSCYSTMLK